MGQIIAAPFAQQPERKRRHIDIEPESSRGLISRDEENFNQPREIILEIITKNTDAAQSKDVLVVDEIVNARDDDMEVAETHIFRPLFRYRAQLEKKKRLSEKEALEHAIVN